MKRVTSAHPIVSFALTLIIFCMSGGAIAQKAALVRDVDRPGGSTRVYQCHNISGTGICELRGGLATFPPPPKFIAAYVSYSLRYCVGCGASTKILNISIACGPNCQDYVPLGTEVVDSLGGNGYISWGGPVTMVWEPNQGVSLFVTTDGPPPAEIHMRVIGHDEFPTP